MVTTPIARALFGRFVTIPPSLWWSDPPRRALLAKSLRHVRKTEGRGAARDLWLTLLSTIVVDSGR